MRFDSRPGFLGTKPLSVVVIAALAAVIFVIDANSNSGVTISVLYVGVVLLAAATSSARIVVLVSICCAVLTVIALVFASQGEDATLGILNDSLSIAANAITTFLVLRALSTGAQLRERVRLLESSHDAVFFRSMSNRIYFWNKAAEEIYGWTREEANGTVPHELLGTVFPEPFEKISAKLHATGRWEGELIHTRKGGEQLIVASRWSLHRDQNGLPSAILETNNDITEARRMQESLDDAQSELARFNRVSLMGEMTASISHEINQPISGAVTNASAALHWLAAEPPNIAKVRSSLERIIKDAHRASDVIGRVRALAKKKPPQKEPTDLNELVSEVLALTDRELHGNSVTVSTHLLSGLPLVEADRIQVQQVILNLVSNAIEAMGMTSPKERGLTVRTGRDPAHLFVEVSDTGPGVQESQAQRLFQSFYTTKDSGMGMGLSISRSIIEAHGGQLSLVPKHSSGACFRFTLPVAASSADQPAQGDRADIRTS
jgi:two-component system, LuxR family, sensor kinase FixL